MSNVVRNLNPAETEQTTPETRCRHAFAQFLGQLRKRKVCRAAVVYMLATWLVLQLGDIIFPLVGLPDWTLTLLALIAALEFPVAMVLAWLFNWTPDGLVIDAPESNSQEPPSPTDFAINIALLLAAALLASQLAWSRGVDDGAISSNETAIAEPKTIVLEPFARAAGTESGAAYGLEDEIRHQLMHLSPATPVSSRGFGADETGRASDGCQLILRGTVFENGDQIRVLLQMVDLQTNRYLFSVSIQANAATTDDVRSLLARQAALVALSENGLDSRPTDPAARVMPRSDDDDVITNAAIL